MNKSDKSLLSSFDAYRKAFFRELCLNITRYRREARLTQAQFAERTNISKDHIAHLEAIGDDTYPSLDTLLLIAYHLDIAPYLLLVREQDWDAARDEE